jgi:hypothetical protein
MHLLRSLLLCSGGPVQLLQLINDHDYSQGTTCLSLTCHWHVYLWLSLYARLEIRFPTAALA